MPSETSENIFVIYSDNIVFLKLYVQDIQREEYEVNNLDIE